MLKRAYLAVALGALLVLSGCNKNTATAIANASVNVTGPNTAVTGISIDPNSDQNLIRESQNGICIARKTFVVKVLPDGGGYSSSVLPSTGATFAAGDFAATVNGTYFLTLSTIGNEHKVTVKINVTGDCGGGPSGNGPGGFNLSANCTVINSSQKQATMSWTNSSGATSYRVERRTWSTGAWASQGNTNSTTFSQGVSRDADYYYRVWALSSGGETLSSPGEILGCGGDVTPPPPPPTGSTYSISISPTSGSGQVGTTQQVTATCRENGAEVACTPTWNTNNPSSVGVNGNGLVSYLSPGSAIITATWMGQSASGSFTATAAPPPPPSVVSISVQPKTALCTVGGQANFGVSVTVTGNASTAVRWTVSDPTVASMQDPNVHQLVLNCLKTGTVIATAQAVADPSKTDFGTLTVNTSGVICSWSPATGLQPDGSVTIAKGQTVAATASCSGGALPAWFSEDPAFVKVGGTTPTTINDKQFQTGNTATVTGVFTTSRDVRVCVQAAIDQTSPAFCRIVKVQ